MGSNRDIWKSQDRECPPCSHCGEVLYEKFWGNGGWQRTSKATDQAHGASDCIKRMALELKTTRAIVDEAQVVANCFKGDVLTKSGAEFAEALDRLRVVLAAYVDPE